MPGDRFRGVKRFFCLTVLCVPAVLHGQRLPSIPHSYAISVSAVSFRVDTTKTIPKTYWLEGGVIGGVALGVLAVMMEQGLSEGDTSTLGHVGAFIIGAGVGFPVGALIGGQFPKQRGGG